MKNILKILITIIIVFFSINKTYTQVLQEWEVRNYSGSGSSISIDNGYVIVAGSYGIAMNKDFCTIRYNSSGIQQWISYYNGSGNSLDFINDMKIDVDGNIYVLGESEGSISGTDCAIVKYSSYGEQKWVARYTTSGNHRDAAYAISTDKNFNIFITGESENDIGGIDCLTIKYDSSGNQLWSRKYNRGINSSNQGFDLTNDDSGNVFVTGRSDGDFMTVKYNSFGIQQWASIYNAPMNENDDAGSIGVDKFGNVFVSGNSIGENFYYDYLTVKYNSLGEEQWIRRYEGSSHFMDQLRAMVIDSLGNVFVTGSSTESGQGYNMTTIKYNTNGDTIWKASYHNGLNDIAFAIALDNQANIYITGESDGNGTSDDYATVKYDSTGQQQWVKRYDHSGQYSDFATSVAVDHIGSVYVTGSSNRDFLTIKYSQLTGVTTNLSKIPSDYMLSQNYPNPFNPITNLEFEISNLGFVSLKVYDVNGREVITLINETKSPGVYKAKFDGSDLSSGIYFYRMEVDGNAIDTKRMILLK